MHPEREMGLTDVQTIRKQMIDLLCRTECGALHLSQMLKIREKDVFDHLAHIRRSVASQDKKLTVSPARCLECGYTFEDRRRVSKPGRCPRCKGEHIQDPTFRID
jgi:transcriptional regulator